MTTKVPGATGDKDSAFSTAQIVLAFTFLFVVLCVFFVVRTTRAHRRANHAMEPAMLAASAGDFEKAERICRELCDR